MKIGDRVRLLKGTEEGTIVGIKKDKIVEVEIDDGFVIPAMKNEVVVIDQKEGETFGQLTTENTEQPREEPQLEISPGIHLAISKEAPSSFHGYLINQTEDTILYSLSIQDKKSISGISYGVITSRSMEDLGDLPMTLLHKGQRLITHCILHQSETKFKKPPITSSISVNSALINTKKFVPSIGSEVALLKIDSQPIEEIDTVKLKENMTEGGTFSERPKDRIKTSGELTIDLHIDADDPSVFPDQVLDFQVEKFEKAYDEALIRNVESLKIIHGVGAGILRNEIHKRLSKKEEVKYFEDGDKERFGFGSTIIYF